MSFDCLGRRVDYQETRDGQVATHFRFVYDNFLCVQRLDAANGNAVRSEFVWDPTEPIATRPLVMRAKNWGLNLFYTHDGNKNVSEVFYHAPQNGIAAHYDYAPFGTVTRTFNATEVLDLAQSGTTATLLARRWESALLVNVDNATLQRLLNHPTAWEVLQKVEGFRNLNKDDVSILVNRTEAIKETKREGKQTGERGKRKLSEEEKEYKSKRKQIQEKLIKFATRIPIFMYLTDDREHSLKEVIAQVETALFERVTGLTLSDFGLLISLGVFNDRVMNAAVLNFKRYEDASLSYAGIDRHAADRTVGAWDTALPRV